MREVKEALFAIKVCESCKDTKIIGDDCIKCKLDKVIDCKIEMNIKLVDKIQKLEIENKKMHDTLLAVYHHLDVKYLDWCEEIIEKTIEIQ